MNSSSRIRSRSPESQFFYPNEKIERLRDRLAESEAEGKLLYQTLLMVCAGYTSPEDGLKLVGIDPARAAQLAAKLPTADEMDAVRREIYGDASRRAQEVPVKGSVVYYVQMNDSVKIGTTWRFASRMRTMYVEPTDVLAVEDGSYDVERQRHHQFAHLRLPGRELFRFDADLRDHMLTLRSERPDPWTYGVDATTVAAS